MFQTQTKASKILGDQSPKLDFTHLVPTCDRHGHWIALGKLPMATHGGRHLPHFKRHNRKFTYQCFTNKMRRKKNTHIIHKEIREIRYNLSNEREYTHSSSSSNMKVLVPSHSITSNIKCCFPLHLPSIWWYRKNKERNPLGRASRFPRFHSNQTRQFQFKANQFQPKNSITLETDKSSVKLFFLKKTYLK
jgi:hypothetical protein